MLDIERLVQHLADNAGRIRALMEGVSAHQARWRPDEASWSILEVINHLYDEEREDFRRRLDLTLHRPDEPWPPIDPQGWAAERAYNQRGLEQSLRNFLSERRASLAWLEGLVAPEWEAVVEAPFGAIRAGDVMAAWVAHDLLHMRQLVELHWRYLRTQVKPYRVIYAGQWEG